MSINIMLLILCLRVVTGSEMTLGKYFLMTYIVLTYSNNILAYLQPLMINVVMTYEKKSN